MQHGSPCDGRLSLEHLECDQGAGEGVRGVLPGGSGAERDDQGLRGRAHGK